MATKVGMSVEVITIDGNSSPLPLPANQDVANIDLEGNDYLKSSEGILALTLTAVMLSIASWRLLAHFYGCSLKNNPNDERHEPMPLREGMTLRRMFHVLFWIAMVMEITGYIFLSHPNASLNNWSSKTMSGIGYTLIYTLGRSVFEYNAFACVTLHWFQSTAKARAGHTERKLAFKICPVILFSMSALLCFHSIMEMRRFFADHTYKSLSQFIQQAHVHRDELLIMGFAWGLQATILIVCATMIYGRLVKLPMYRDLNTLDRVPIISRMILPQIGCILAYTLRCLMLVSAYFVVRQDQDKDIESGVLWWILEGWIPSIVASCVLFYSLRKRDRINLAESHDGQPPRPPIEAFISFQHTIYEGEGEGDDNGDDSYLLPSGRA